MLNGAKKWIGNATIADVVVVWAKLGDSNDQAGDSRLPGGERQRRISPTLIDGKLSLRIGLTAEIEFNDCAVSADALLPQSRGLRSPLECLNHARFGIAWGAIGAAMACYDEARQYALQRYQFGKPIASFQLVQAKLVGMLTEITKAQLLAYRVAQLKDAGAAKHYHISMAKMNNVGHGPGHCPNCSRPARRGRHSRFACLHAAHVQPRKRENLRRHGDIHRLILGQQITGILAF